MYGYERLTLAAMLLRSSGGDSAPLLHCEKLTVEMALLLDVKSLRLRLGLQQCCSWINAVFLPRDGGSGRIMGKNF